jgi:oligoribonuclease (3'-5' exoribonuclease)
MFDNVMIDLETLSEAPNAAIVSIGAVVFNMHDTETENFYINIDPRDSKQYEMDISQSTIDWWRKQNPEATRAWIKNGVPVLEAAESFVHFLQKYTVKKDVTIWANGIDFDLPIIKNLLRVTKNELQWYYWNQMDCRTIFKLANFDTKTAKRVGKYHNALDDCHNQLRWLKEINGTP